MNWWTTQQLREGIQRVIQQHEEPMQTITQEVTNTTGLQATISTVRGEDESTGDWIIRHNEAVTEFEAT